MTSNDEVHIKPIIVSHHYHQQHQHQQIQDTTSSSLASSLENNVSSLPKSASSSFKRVSFGNSKGTVVETFIYESVPTIEEGYYYGQASPSGSSSNQTQVRERPGVDTPPSKVKVKTLESQTPLYIPPPSTIVNAGSTKLNNGGFAGGGGGQPAGVLIVEKRYVANQTSPLPKMDEETENPFRPDGRLSHEVDPIVESYKKRPFPISAAGTDFVDGAVINVQSSKSPPSSPAGKKEKASSPLLSSSNNGQAREAAPVTKPQDIKLTLTTADGHNTQLEIQHKQLTSPKAGHVEVVHIGEKRKKCGCCSIQ